MCGKALRPFTGGEPGLFVFPQIIAKVFHGSFFQERRLLDCLCVARYTNLDAAPPGLVRGFSKNLETATEEPLS